jgi:flagellar motor switch protein FliM
MPPNERILSLTFEIRMSTVSGMLIMAFPAVAANALIRKLVQQGSYRRHRTGAAGDSHLREKLGKCSFKVELILPGGSVRSRQLFALERGSILPLHSKVDEPAILCAGKQALFTAQPVRSENHRAAQIVQKVVRGDLRQGEKIDQ